MMLIESIAACGVGVAAGLGIGFLDGLFGCLGSSLQRRKSWENFFSVRSFLTFVYKLATTAEVKHTKLEKILVSIKH